MAITIEDPADRDAARAVAYDAAFQEFSVSHDHNDAFAKACHAVIDLKVKIFEPDRLIGKATRDAITAIEEVERDAAHAARVAHRKSGL